MVTYTTIVVPSSATLELITDGSTSGRYWKSDILGFPIISLPINQDFILGPFNSSTQFTVEILVGTGFSYVLAPGANITAEVSRAEAAEAAETSRAEAAEALNATAAARPYVATAHSADGAISVFTGTHTITKTSIALLTLAAPSAPQEGSTFTITNKTAYAHTVTATGLINKGDASSPYTTLTWPVYVGASITLVACNLHWNVVANNGVLFS